MSTEKTENTDDVELTRLTPEQWGARLRERFPGLFSAYGSDVDDELPPGWRGLVEETFEQVEVYCDRIGLKPEDETYPEVVAVQALGDALSIQLCTDQRNVLGAVGQAGANSLKTCQGCAEVTTKLESLEVDFESRVLGRTVRRTRRLCPDCVAAERPQPDPERSVQVLAYVMECTDRRERDALAPYQRALVDTRTPLAPIPDVETVNRTLSSEFPWMGEVTGYVVAELAARQFGDGLFRLPPLLLSGPPGMGKTAYAQRLAELAGTAVRVLPLAGESSSMVVKGCPRGWASARPGVTLELIMQAGVANPLVILDELDKAGGSEKNGNAQEALLALLEGDTAERYYDAFVQGPADLSWVSWLATCNDADRIIEPLRSRLQEIEVPPPKLEEYAAVVERTVKRYAAERRIPMEVMPRLGELEWARLQRSFTSPRAARWATERMLSALLARSGPDGPSMP